MLLTVSTGKTMAYIRTLPNGKHRVEIRKKQVSIQNKNFSDKSDAEQWAEDFESKIETILNIKSKKLKKISPEKVEKLGGMPLFLTWLLTNHRLL